jgi:hypothetical protein
MCLIIWGVDVGGIVHHHCLNFLVINKGTGGECMNWHIHNNMLTRIIMESGSYTR